MDATRTELAVSQMESYDEATVLEYGCDDVRTARLSAELNGVASGFDALWLDR